MTIRKRVHMIQVLSKNYRETCLPYPTNIVDTVHIKLPLIANKRNEDLLTIIKVGFHIYLIKKIIRSNSLCNSYLI